MESGECCKLHEGGGSGAEPRPQTHFDAFEVLKKQLMATDSQHFREFETTIRHQKKIPQFVIFYFPQLFPGSIRSILLPSVS